MIEKIVAINAINIDLSKHKNKDPIPTDIPITGRCLPVYCNMFGYGPNGEQLRGKVILDVGAGNSNFAQEANLKHQAKVTSFDASYQKHPPEDKANKVTGVAQKLPFKDEAFDEVIASYSIIYISDRGDLQQAIKEMLRVTKNGGAVKICPAFYPKKYLQSPNHNIELPPQASFISHPSCDLTLVVKKDPSTQKQINTLLGIVEVSSCQI